MRSRRFFVACGVASLLAFTAMVDSVWALTLTTPRLRAPVHNASPVVAELHSAKVLLERADRDYDGHRAKAVQHINEALRELGGQSYHAHKSAHARHAQHHSGKMREPQVASDVQLREAAALVAKAQNQLGAIHPKVQAQLILAEKELAVALKIR
jgi:hypothetical protein